MPPHPETHRADDRRRRARDVAQRLADAGFTAYWAGGCVRDMLLGKTPKDYDVATNATPDEILRLFPGSQAFGKAFAVVQVRLDGIPFEVATFRKDHGYSDGRRPDAVSFADPETDAQRRDFTINAMFYDPLRETVIDFAGGQADLAARLVRCVGDPDQRFTEDHLRLLRAVRFATSLDFAIEPATADAIRRKTPLLSRISAERVRDELTRIFQESVRAGQALVLLDSLNLLAAVLPELLPMKGQAQPPQFHPEGDVFQHTVIMLDHLASRDIRLVLAVLFHDIGKPATVQATAERLRFNGHAAAGAAMADSILQRLRFPNDVREPVVHCVRNHMRIMDADKMKASTLRKLVGSPTFETEMELHRLDCLASHGDQSNWQLIMDFKRRVDLEGPPLPKPWISGDDIMSLGIPQSPAIGAWRRAAYDAQLEGRFPDRDALLQWLTREIRNGGGAGHKDSRRG